MVTSMALMALILMALRLSLPAIPTSTIHSLELDYLPVSGQPEMLALTREKRPIT